MVICMQDISDNDRDSCDRLNSEPSTSPFCREEDVATTDTLNKLAFKRPDKTPQPNNILDWINFLQPKHEIKENSDEWSDVSGEEAMLYKEKLFIAKNNIKLNIFLNILLIASLGIICSIDWFCYEGKV